MFRSTSLRLAAVYTLMFSIAVVVLGTLTLFTTRQALSADVDARIRAESAALVQEFRTEGLPGVLGAVRERDRTPGALNYGLEGPGSRAMAGRLAGAKAPLGWSVLRIAQPGGELEPIRVYTSRLPGDLRLVVGDDLDRIETLDGAVIRGFGWAFVGVVLLGVGGGYAFSRDIHRRLAAISATAEAIIDGDLGSRVPLRGSDDDLDRLAATFNRMLDRIAALMETLKQVSNDIAHDMRTPLTRLRQKLETGLAQPGERGQALESALTDLDAILETFAALLRIAQIQSGARRAAFRPTDLSTVAQTVVEAFSPSAEDARQTLTLEATGPVLIEGDPELLTQMLVNLVENALRHAGAGSRIRVRASSNGSGAQLTVIDDGPGVPAAERERLFDRFYRLERSRSTPGSGLGLALVSAVAELHGAEVKLADANPGLEACVTFPRPPPRATDARR